MTFRARRSRRGAALILAVLLVFAAATLALVVAERSRSTALDRVRERAELRGLHAAAGGIEHARWTILHDGGAARMQVEVDGLPVDVRIDEHEDGTRTVRASARVSGAPFADSISRVVEADLAAGDGGLPRVLAWRER